MTDTLFVRQTIPLSETPYDWADDRVVLPSGIEVAVITTLETFEDGTPRYDPEDGSLVYDIVLQIREPGGAVAHQIVLPLPTGDSTIIEYSADLVTAPGGGLAVLYETATHSEGDGSENWHKVALPLGADGLPLGGPVVLSTGLPFDGYWSNQAYFDGGGYAWLQYRTLLDADGFYIGERPEVFRTTSDGTAYPPLPIPETPDIYAELFQALPDGRLIVVWQDYYNDARMLQVYTADGRSTPPTPVGPGSYSGSPQLLSLAEGPLLLWPEEAYDDAGGYDEMLKAAALTPDGALGPVRNLIDLDGDESGTYAWVNDIRVFDDGGFGVLFSREVDGNFQILYQSFAADGAAVAGPEALVDLPASYEAFQTTAWLLPGGGAVLLEPRGIEGEGIPLFLRHFAPDGTPLGPAARIAEIPADSYAYGYDLDALPGGDTLLSWTTEGPGPDGNWQTTEFRAGFAPIPFRGLTEAGDTEILTAPEAVDGLAGDDAITGSDGVDRLLGGAGNDTLAGGAGDDFLFGGAGTNLLDGGAGMDAAHFAGRFDQFEFTFSSDGTEVTVTGAGSIDQLAGIERFDFDDRSVTATDLLLDAGFYDDSIAGTDAADTVVGDLGDDTLQGLAGDDLLDGGTGRDAISGGDGRDTLIGGPETGDGGDRIFGGDGNDSITGGAGNDLLYGQNGDDTLAGGFGADQLFGQIGNDLIAGGALSDLVFGGDGDDFINGGFGHDRINGGSGADQFYHAGVRGHGSDWLQDYNSDDGDMLVFGKTEAGFDEFRLVFAHAGAGETVGDGDVAEAFIAHVPSGFVVWALVDGAAQDHIWLKIPDTGTVDLLTLL